MRHKGEVMNNELLIPYDIKQLNDDAIEKISYEIRDKYNPKAVSPYELTCNIDVIAQLIQLFSYMSAKCSSEYAIKKLECNVAENKALHELRKNWNESTDGKAPAIDYFKAQAALQVKELKEEANKLETMALNFKAASDSYKERIAAIKYKINAIAIEENGRKQI